MAKVPGFAKAFAGHWRIVEMDNWKATFSILSKSHLMKLSTLALASALAVTGTLAFAPNLVLPLRPGPPANSGRATKTTSDRSDRRTASGKCG